MRDDRIEAKRAAATLDEPAEEARNLADRLGLNPYPFATGLSTTTR